MIKKNRVIFTLVLLSLLFSISVPNVFALVEKKSISDLTMDSDNIITGKVLSRESYWDNGNIFTNVTISVDNRIKGNSGNQVTVKVRGGTVGDIYEEVSDVPLFDDNEKVLLFLKENSVVGWNQGKYSIQNDSIKDTGEPLAEFVNNIEQNLQTQVSGKNMTIGYVGYTGDYSGGYIGRSSNATPLLIPHITNVTPSSGPAIATELGSGVAASNSTRVTIDGSNFGSTNGSVKFLRVGTTWYDATIVSWADTKIVVKVPGRISSGTQPGSDGNVQVFTSGSAPSDNYGNFDVTYSYGGGKFPGIRVTYMVNPNNVGAVNIVPAIQAATDTWNNVGANFGFVYGGLSSKTDVAMDGENSVIFVNYDTGSVATTTTWWSGTYTKTIMESDIAFNDLSVNWGIDNSATKMDVQTVAVHEFGHWLQLLDLYGSADSKKVMYGYVSYGVTKRVLDASDINGIKWIYGNNASVPTADISVYYRGLGVYPNIVETADLLKAVDDWRDNIIPPGFSVSITTDQLLTLVDEWRNS
jgi:hypothetical protein